MTADIFKTKFYTEAINDPRDRNHFDASFVRGTVAAGVALRRRAAELLDSYPEIAAELAVMADVVEGLTTDDIPFNTLYPR